MPFLACHRLLACLFFFPLILAACVAGQALWRNVPASPAASGPGSVDTSFGVQGSLIVQMGDGESEIVRVLGYPSGSSHEGKILVGGTAKREGRKIWVIARYTREGALDPEFGTGGFTETATPLVDLTLVDMKLYPAPDESIAVTGDSSSQQILLGRYLSNGNFDPNFNGGLPRARKLANQNSAGRAVMGLANGEVVAAATVEAPAISYGYASCDKDGNDNTARFNGKGEVVTDRPGLATVIEDMNPTEFFLVGTSPNTVDAIEISANKYGDGTQTRSTVTSLNGNAMPHGKQTLDSDEFAVGGTLSPTSLSGSRFFWTRHDSANFGQTFNFSGGSGVVTTLIGERCEGRALGVFADRVYIGGFATQEEQDFMALARYLFTGELDTAFNIVGYLTLPLGEMARANSMTIQSDGKIVLGGYAIVGGIKKFALARITP